MPAQPHAPVIVIVDDEIDIVLSLAECLKDLVPGAVIFPAGSAREALDFVCDRPVDIVITDYRMPDMNGEQLLRVLKESRNSPAAIMMTAYPSPGLTFRTGSEGAAHALFAKPFDATLMAESVRDILEQRARATNETLPRIPARKSRPPGTPAPA